MPATNEPPPRNLLDRVIRESLNHPANLRAFLGRAVPDLAGGFDCDRARLLDRDFPLDDRRDREADLLFKIPYRAGAAELWALVVVLLEHQSDTDLLLPLRLLYFAVTYWERQRRAWEQAAAPRPPLRLRPVLPIVLYTAATPWDSNRTLVDLLDEPAAFHAFAPSWQPLFWNLADQTPEGLLASGEEWLQALAVLRVEGEGAARFEAVYREALQHLQGLYGRDQVRWYDLMRIMLTWALWRRPAAERMPLLAAAQVSQKDAGLQREIETMTQTIAESLIAEGQVKGRVEGRVEGELLTSRAVLRRLLTKRFGPLPESLLQRIEATTDAGRLQACIEQVLELGTLDELQL